MTTTMYRVEGLRTALVMARAIEQLAQLPGVSEVTVNLVRHGSSLLWLRATPNLAPALVSDCLSAVGAHMEGAGPRAA